MVAPGDDKHMVADKPDRRWMVPVFALFVSAFAVCTSELIIAGLLPALAADLDVDIPTAGLLITGYALGVAVAGPILALLTTGVSRRLLLVRVMGLLVVGSVLCALSTSYWMLLAARLVVASGHGLFFGLAMVLATRLAPPGRQTTAVSLVITGVTLSNILGIPLGTAIGNALGWRVTFWAIAGAGLVAAIVLALLIPAAPEQPRSGDRLRAELRAAVQPVVLLCYAISIAYMTGVFAMFAYLVPLLTDVSGIPIDYVPWVLFGMGFVGFFGTLIGGRLGDWNGQVAMVGISSVCIVFLIIMSQLVHISWAALACLWTLWLVGFGFAPTIRTRIVKESSDAPTFAATLTSSAFNIGIASGAAIGGAAIAAGWGYGALPLINAAGLGVALLGVLLLGLIGRRPAIAPA